MSDDLERILEQLGDDNDFDASFLEVDFITNPLGGSISETPHSSESQSLQSLKPSHNHRCGGPSSLHGKERMRPTLMQEGDAAFSASKSLCRHPCPAKVVKMAQDKN